MMRYLVLRDTLLVSNQEVRPMTKKVTVTGNIGRKFLHSFSNSFHEVIIINSSGQGLLPQIISVTDYILPKFFTSPVRIYLGLSFMTRTVSPGSSVNMNPLKNILIRSTNRILYLNQSGTKCNIQFTSVQPYDVCFTEKSKNCSYNYTVFHYLLSIVYRR